mgnify:CR=1 FL=1
MTALCARRLASSQRRCCVWGGMCRLTTESRSVESFLAIQACQSGRRAPTGAGRPGHAWTGKSADLLRKFSFQAWFQQPRQVLLSNLEVHSRRPGRSRLTRRKKEFKHPGANSPAQPQGEKKAPARLSGSASPRAGAAELVASTPTTGIPAERDPAVPTPPPSSCRIC